MNITYRHFVFFTYLVGTAIFKDYYSCEISSISYDSNNYSRHDIAEILLKVALNTKKSINQLMITDDLILQQNTLITIIKPEYAFVILHAMVQMIYPQCIHE